MGSGEMTGPDSGLGSGWESSAEPSPRRSRLKIECLRDWGWGSVGVLESLVICAGEGDARSVVL
jgi:hypothetical protein